jgi:hypothetical protein
VGEREEVAAASGRLDLLQRHRRAQRSIVLAAVVAVPLVVDRVTLSAFGTPKSLVVWLTAAAAGAVALSAAGVARRGTVGRLPVAGAVAVLLGGLVVAAAAAPDGLRAVLGYHGRHVGVLTYVAAAILLATTASAFRRDPGDGALVTDHPVAGLLRALLLAGSAVTGYGLLQALGADPVDWDAPAAHPQVFSTLGNENFLAGWLAVVGTAALWGATTRTWTAPWRVACAGLAAAALVVTLATTSAQGPLAWAVGAGVLALVRSTDPERAPRRRRRGPLPALLAAGALFGALALATTGQLAALGDDLATSARDRTELWGTAARMGADHPLVGVGPDAFAEHYPRYRPLARALRYDAVRPVATQAHNVPLHLFAGGGVLPLGGWLAWVAATALVGVRGLRVLRGERRLLLGGVLAAWGAYLAQSIVSIDVPPLLVSGWVLSGAVLAAAPPGSTRTWRLPAAARVTALLAAVTVLAAALVGLERLWAADRAAGAAARAERLELLDVNADHALALAPWEPAYPLAAGRRAHALGEEQRALTLLDEAARRNPRLVQAQHDRARVARGLGLVAEAAEVYRVVALLVPTSPSVLEEAADALVAAGAADEAARLRERAAALRR